MKGKKLWRRSACAIYQSMRLGWAKTKRSSILETFPLRETPGAKQYHPRPDVISSGIEKFLKVENQSSIDMTRLLGEEDWEVGKEVRWVWTSCVVARLAWRRLRRKGLQLLDVKCLILRPRIVSGQAVRTSRVSKYLNVHYTWKHSCMMNWMCQ